MSRVRWGHRSVYVYASVWTRTRRNDMLIIASRSPADDTRSEKRVLNFSPLRAILRVRSRAGTYCYRHDGLMRDLRRCCVPACGARVFVINRRKTLARGSQHDVKEMCVCCCVVSGDGYVWRAHRPVCDTRRAHIDIFALI